MVLRKLDNMAPKSKDADDFLDCTYARGRVVPPLPPYEEYLKEAIASEKARAGGGPGGMRHATSMLDFRGLAAAGNGEIDALGASVRAPTRRAWKKSAAVATTTTVRAEEAAAAAAPPRMRHATSMLDFRGLVAAGHGDGDGDDALGASVRAPTRRARKAAVARTVRAEASAGAPRGRRQATSMPDFRGLAAAGDDDDALGASVRAPTRRTRKAAAAAATARAEDPGFVGFLADAHKTMTVDDDGADDGFFIDTSGHTLTLSGHALDQITEHDDGDDAPDNAAPARPAPRAAAAPAKPRGMRRVMSLSQLRRK